MKILLASQSPRRRELLEQLGFDFETVSVECDEVFPAATPPEKVAAYLAELKAGFYTQLRPNEVLLTADTVVVLNGEILGKPGDALHAREMLMKLSGKTHQVYTAVTLKTAQKCVTLSDVAHVTFAEISEKECAFYIEEFRPFDKAGAYGIQDWLGMAKVARIDGSFYTVMGLPTHLVYAHLADLKNSYEK